MEITLDMTAIRNKTVRELANQIGCKVPAADDSPGGLLLQKVRDETVEAVENAISLDNEPDSVKEGDDLNNIEGLAPAKDKAEMWSQFVDLGGWDDSWREMNDETIRGLIDEWRYTRELPFGDKVPSISSFAVVALMEMARTLAWQLTDELQTQYEAIEPDDEEGLE
ncbi:hypothetical protein [Nocardia jiangxiensis]|uniref:hypothetical protein n=1 Tax=Nocardia jiangxiensis TaxID=282685 RepID=UPI0002F897FE|nr:hypothetical protein [Nocardia jiangxiensis]